MPRTCEGQLPSFVTLPEQSGLSAAGHPNRDPDLLNNGGHDKRSTYPP